VSAQPAVASVALQRMVPPEEAARADFYALLASLFVGPPAQDLIAHLAAARPIEGDAALARAWLGLTQASAAMDSDAAAIEYDELFAGVGKARVSIYAGYYTGAPARDHPRIRIQAALAALGLARDPRATEPEDHLAGLFEVMRVLVAGVPGRPAAALADQKRFFEEHVGPGATKFFAALAVFPQANYYRHAAAVGAAFMALESESFLLV
jgi:TorA maturation chaperone TorD